VIHTSLLALTLAALRHFTMKPEHLEQSIALQHESLQLLSRLRRKA
jgi:hypothetical protein